MADVVASAAGGKLVEYVIGPIVNQLKYLFCYTTNIKNLRDALKELELKKTRVLHKVHESETNAEIIEEDVKAWLDNVENKKKEADAVLNVAANSVMWCLKCPNLKFRYLQGRKATKIATTIVELQKKGEFENVGFREPPSIPILMPCSVEGLETRESTKKEIIKALEDEQIFIVGICGMAGVGKTTMVKEIADGVKKSFDEVAFVVVSKDPPISKVQNHIAEALGLKINDDSEEVRATRLNDRLTRDVQKKILVILDDVWEEINFETIGIPRKGARKGLKILLTSRSQHVCKQMGADGRIHEVEVLSENEALELLKDAAMISNETSEVVNDLATQVAKECGGLPLALDLIGKGLIDVGEYAWRDILLQLKNSTVGDERVYKSIEISYSNLKNEDDKSLFLLCSLFPEDYNISIETLVRYARGLEMFKDTAILSETRDRVYSIVDRLKSCHLLLSGDKEDKVKLHDVVRDFCLQFATRVKDVYMVKQDGVKEWPKRDKEGQLTAISLAFDDKVNELPSGLEYPNLNLLKMVCQSKEMNISNDFFLKMNQLKVVDFNSLVFNHIPSSLQSLTNLQTLCLEGCELYIGLSTIESLKKLEILSFFESRISEFPTEIAQLRNLKLLDLRFYKCPHRLPRGVLSSLNELEELYLGAHFTTQGGGKQDLDQVEKVYIIGELSSIKNLKTFQICVNDPGFLLQILKRMHLEKLQRFQIICTEIFEGNGEYHIGRSLRIEKLEGSLFPRTDDLLLENVDGSLNNLLRELDKDGFVNLKTLNLNRCSFEYLIDTAKLSLSPTSAFSELEELKLGDLSNLKGIYSGNLPAKAFARLQTVRLTKLPCIEHLWRGVFEPPSLCPLRNFNVESCDVIKSLFSESAAKCLLNLESIVVLDCKMLEHIVSRDTTEDEITDQVLEFKKLRDLSFYNLNNLKGFRSQSDVDSKQLFNQVAFPNLERIFVNKCHGFAKIMGDEIQPNALEKLRSMTVGFCGDVKTIAQSNSIKALQNLESLGVHGCSHIDVLFELEGLKVTKDETQSILSHLTYLALEGVPKLVHIVWRVPKGLRVFENLTSLSVMGCNSIRYLFTPSMASSLAGLETLELRYCNAIEEIFGREEETEMAEPASIGEFNKLEFPKLRTLRLEELEMFCCENIELVFPSLDLLEIDRCPKMIKLYSQGPLAPRLKELIIAGMNFTSTQMSWIKDRCPNLEKLSITNVQCESKTLIDEVQPINVFQNLTSLRLKNCESLKYLFTPSTAGSLGSLETLKLEFCVSIEEIIGREEEIEMVEPTFMNKGGGEFNEIVFAKLSTLELLRLESLRMFCSENIKLVFPSLDRLVIRNCPEMVKFSAQ